VVSVWEFSKRRLVHWIWDRVYWIPGRLSGLRTNHLAIQHAASPGNESRYTTTPARVAALSRWWWRVSTTKRSNAEIRFRRQMMIHSFIRSFVHWCARSRYEFQSIHTARSSMDDFQPKGLFVPRMNRKYTIKICTTIQNADCWKQPINQRQQGSSVSSIDIWFSWTIESSWTKLDKGSVSHRFRRNEWMNERTNHWIRNRRLLLWWKYIFVTVAVAVSIGLDWMEGMLVWNAHHCVERKNR